MISEAIEVLVRIRGENIHLSIGEVLVDQGWVSPDLFLKARQIAARQKVYLIDRSSMRDFNIRQDEDRRIGERAVEVGLLTQAQFDAAAVVQRKVEEICVSIPIAKVFADHKVLDIEVSEGLLLLLRHEDARARGESPPDDLPFTAADLITAAAALESDALTVLQIARGLKVIHRMGQAGLKKNLVEIFHEQRMLDRPAIDAIVPLATSRLPRGHRIPLTLTRIGPAARGTLDDLVDDGGQISAAATSQIAEVRRALKQRGIDRSPGTILLDLGLIDPQSLTRNLPDLTSDSIEIVGRGGTGDRSRERSITNRRSTLGRPRGRTKPTRPTSHPTRPDTGTRRAGTTAARKKVDPERAGGLSPAVVTAISIGLLAIAAALVAVALSF